MSNKYTLLDYSQIRIVTRACDICEDKATFIYSDKALCDNCEGE